MVLPLVLMFAATIFAAKLAFTRPRSFGVFILPAGILAFGAESDGLGGLANLSAVWLLILIVLSLVCVAQLGRSGTAFSTPEKCYLLFLGWCAIEAARASYFSYALRAYLKLLFPFLSMYIARRSVDSTPAAAMLVRWQVTATLAAGALFVLMMVLPGGAGEISSVLWTGAAFFDHAAILAMLALACWKIRKRSGYAWLTLLLVAICFRAVNRTTMMALALGGSAFCILEFRKLAVVLLPALYLGLGAVVLSVPAFREKMFYAPQNVDTGAVLSASTITGDQFNSNGRFAMWDKVLGEFFWPRPLVGAGLGATQAWFYTGAARDAGCGSIRIEHSEYVKLLSDTGVIGLALFLASLLCSMLEGIRAYRRSTAQMSRIFSIAAICGVPVFLVCLAFDNALLYVLPVAQFPMAFAAIASRLSEQHKQCRRPPRSDGDDRVLWLRRRPLGRRFADEEPLPTPIPQ